LVVPILVSHAVPNMMPPTSPPQPHVAGVPPGYVYVLGTCTARGPRTYVGWTLDPARRLDQHNAGTGAKSTRGLNWSLLYVERLGSRIEAMSREWHLKRDRRFRGELARALS
jgi:putative endonuclease